MPPLLTDFQRAKLEANGREQAAVKGTAHEIDFVPVVKLQDREEGTVWLLTEIDPDLPHKAWGLCLGDPDNPEPHMGSVDLKELASVQEVGFLTVDAAFVPSKPISAYLFPAQLLDGFDL